MKERLLQLLRENGFKQGEFTLASGKKSDFYIDVRSVALSSEGHWLLGRLMFEEILKFNKGLFSGRYPGKCQIEAVAGVELGGCSLASAVSLMSDFERRLSSLLTSPDRPPLLPALYIRKKAKDHGTKKLIEAPAGVQKGIGVVLLEDVITTGGSTIRAAKSLQEAGFTPVCVIVAVDRMEGGRGAIETEMNMPVMSLLNRRDFIPEK